MPVNANAPGPAATSPPREARSFWVVGPSTGEIRTQRLAPPGDGEVAVRTLYSGISRGTEAIVFQGRVPSTQVEAMRAPFQEGAFPWPVKYGYASVGTVEAGPPELAGRAVFCLYPHQTAYVVPADAVVPLPPDLPPARAVLAANMETALNGLWDAAPRAGDRIAVVGGGVVGCLVAHLAARMPGCEVELIDTDQRRAAVATALGIRFALPATARPEADLVLHASGTPAGLATALRLAGFEATVVELSWFGDRPVQLPLGEAFHARRLRLVSSQVGTVAAAQRARWTHRRRIELALRLLLDDRLERLITGDTPFEALPALMARLSAEPDGELCRRVTYPD